MNDEQNDVLRRFEEALCVQFDGEVMPEDYQRAYWVWHNEVRPVLGWTCPVVELTGEHGESCPFVPSR